MSTMNQTEYAKHAGVTRKTVSRWIKSGKYVVMVGELIDVEATDAVLAQYRDAQDLRTNNAKKKSSIETLEDRATTAVKNLLSSGGKVRSIEESRAIKEYYLAELARLEYEEKESLLLPWEVIVKEVAQEYSRARTRLMAIAPEHGPRLRVLAASLKDKEFVAAFQDVMYEAMDELSVDKQKPLLS